MPPSLVPRVSEILTPSHCSAPPYSSSTLIPNDQLRQPAVDGPSRRQFRQTTSAMAQNTSEPTTPTASSKTSTPVGRWPIASSLRKAMTLAFSWSVSGHSPHTACIVGRPVKSVSIWITACWPVGFCAASPIAVRSGPSCPPPSGSIPPTL